MPAFLDDELLSRQEISNVVDFVISLSNSKAAVPKGAAALFADNCSSCHGPSAKGSTELGAPNLTDVKWLYGGDRETIIHTVSHSRKGVMPTWDGRLSPATIKGLAVYVHTLGGGQESTNMASEDTGEKEE
jgi:cytochrome c oxidase cbb3-type subunit 3